MKRKRGLKRYYRNLLIENDFKKKGVDLWFEESDIWFDNWHTHFDWYGYGNDSFKRRKPHLDKLFRHFYLLADLCKKIKTNFQLYVILLDFDSRSDALYLHTPNPNNSQFPLVFENIKPNSTLNNKELIDYIENLNEFEKLYGLGYEDEGFCLLYKKEIGIDFKQKIYEN